MRRIYSSMVIALLLSSPVFNTNVYGYSTNHWRTMVRKGGKHIAAIRNNLPRQILAGVAAVAIACTVSSCARNTVEQDVINNKTVVNVSHDYEASLNEVVENVAQIEGAQIGIVQKVDQASGVVEIATEDDTTYLQLPANSVLINNSEQSLRVSQEEDEGWIAPGSMLALIPAWAVAALMGVHAVRHFYYYWSEYSPLWFHFWLSSSEPVRLIFATPTAAVGTYYLLVML